MTEAEWRAATNPKAMIEWVRISGAASDRKFRLFSVACCRRVWPCLRDDRARRAVEVAERHADGAATEEEWSDAQRGAAEVRGLGGMAAKWAAAASARTGAVMVTDAAGQAAACPPGRGYDPDQWGAEWRAQCDLLRDLFDPLPFRQVAIAPAWRTAQVIELAQAIYDEQTFGRLLGLGQALSRAGCDDREVLHHCVWAGGHARGCWLVDLVLNKK